MQVVTYSASAQLNNIDSLKKILPSLHDSARIDCLNEIVYYYLSLNNIDSVKHYLVFAYEESKKLKLLMVLQFHFFKGRHSKNYGNDPEAEKLATESLEWYQRTSNKKYIDIPYYQLGREFFAQSMWKKAIINLKQSFYWANKAVAYDRALSALSLIGEVYREGSNYDSAFDIFKQELQMAEQYKDTLRIEGAFAISAICIRLLKIIIQH